MGILSTTVEFNPISDAVAAAFLGVENWKSVCTTEQYDEYVVWVRHFLKFPSRHPEAYAMACEEHGTRYIEQFMNRCKMFVQRYDFDHIRPPGTLNDANLHILTSQDWELDSNAGSVSFDDPITNKAYRIFTHCAALDAALLIGSSRMYYADMGRRFALCASYGIGWADQCCEFRFFRECSDIQLTFIRELADLGVDSRVIDSLVLDSLLSNPLILMDQEFILESVKGGMPVEYIFAAMGVQNA